MIVHHVSWFEQSRCRLTVSERVTRHNRTVWDIWGKCNDSLAIRDKTEVLFFRFGMRRASDLSRLTHVATGRAGFVPLHVTRVKHPRRIMMVGLQNWWKMAVLSAGMLSTSGLVAAERPASSARNTHGRLPAAAQSSRVTRGNPFALVSEDRAVEPRSTQRRLSPVDPTLSDEEASVPLGEDRSAQSTRPGETAADGEKTAFFGCGWGFGCGPCRPACRPVCGPVGYGCPSPYPTPCNYGPGYGGGCAPVGGCYPPPAPAGGFYSGPVLPPAISSPVIGAPAGYYGGGYYPGYGAQGYGAPGYGVPGYGYPVYGEARPSTESKANSQFDREMTGKTRAVSRLQQDHPRNPFAD